MGSDSIAHEAKGLIGYWLKGHEGERNNYYCFSKIQLVGEKKVSRQNILRLLKLDLILFCQQNITNTVWWVLFATSGL